MVLGSFPFVAIVLFAVLTGGARAAEREVTVQLVGGKPVDAPAVIRISQGDVLRLTVRADARDELHVHGYDVLLLLRAGTPATAHIEATASGRFPVTSHHATGLLAHRPLFHIEVLPR